MTGTEDSATEETKTTSHTRTAARSRRTVLHGVGAFGVLGLLGGTTLADASQSTHGRGDYTRGVRDKTADKLPAGLFQQVQKLLADDGDEFDFFGFSVALTEDTAFIGATGDEETGSVYVFMRQDGQWTQTQKLLPKDTDEFNNFGFSVALTENIALIGAPSDDENGTDAGAAYVFTRQDGQWTQTQKLLSNDGDEYDSFGLSVALTEDTALVGAPYDEENGESAGSAYVFSRQNGQWIQTQKLLANDGDAGDSFGWSVALTKNTALIGADGDEDKGEGAGSAYVFTQQKGRWTQTQKLLAGDGGEFDRFGASVALVEDTALIGAPGDDEVDNLDQGSAYIFTRQKGQWIQTQKLLANDGDADDFFGDAVALTRDTALIGAVGDEENEDLSGSAYIFTRQKSQWIQTQKLLANDGDFFDFFGDSVALAGDTALIGAYLDEENGTESGSAYIFRRMSGDQCPPGLDIVFRYECGEWQPDTCNKNGEEVSPDIFSIDGNQVKVTICAPFPFAVSYATRKKHNHGKGGWDSRDDWGEKSKHEKKKHHREPNSGNWFENCKEQDPVLAEPVDSQYCATISSADDGKCKTKKTEIRWFRVYCPDTNTGH